jgi:hypothetical protein
MPTTIRTEQARRALAHREYDQAVAEIERALEARADVLKRDPRATDLASFQKLCIADPEFGKLVLAKAASKAWRDGNIADGCIPTIEDDGEVRWVHPRYAAKPS